MSSCLADMSIRLTCAFILAILVAPLGFGQQQADADRDKATLSGTVRDQNKTAVAGAKMSLNYAGIATLVTETDEHGFYSFAGIAPGTYNLSATAPNLGEKTVDNINLAPGLELKVNVSLEPPTDKNDINAAASGSEQPHGHQNKGSGYGALSGTVTDQSQAVVIGAKVSLTNAAGTTLETRTDAKGAYSFVNLPANTYNLSATAPNFAVKSFDSIGLTTGLELTLDISLQPASEKTEVNVESSDLGKVETETSTVSGTITATEVVSLQLNGRNFSQLIALAPGVSNQTGQDEAKVGVSGA